MKSQNLWTELRQHIRGSFNIALEASRVSRGLLFHQNVFPADDVHEIVLQYVEMISFYDHLQTIDDFIRSILSSFRLCEMDPRHLLMRVVSLVLELVVEVKVQLLALLHDHSVNNLAEIFLTGQYKRFYFKYNYFYLLMQLSPFIFMFFPVGLVDDYDALLLTALKISDIVKPLKDHLRKFNYNYTLTWDCFITKLYQIYIYDDPLVQNNLLPFIGKVCKTHASYLMR